VPRQLRRAAPRQQHGLGGIVNPLGRCQRCLCAVHALLGVAREEVREQGQSLCAAAAIATTAAAAAATTPAACQRSAALFLQHVHQLVRQRGDGVLAEPAALQQQRHHAGGAAAGRLRAPAAHHPPAAAAACSGGGLRESAGRIAPHARRHALRPANKIQPGAQDLLRPAHGCQRVKVSPLRRRLLHLLDAVLHGQASAQRRAARARG
jgi:hypothetical protein